MISIFDFIGWTTIIVVLVVCILRAYLKGASFTEHVSCKELVAVVTGCDGGIGKQIVRELNYRGAKVYMLCRNKTKGEEAVKHLVQMGAHAGRLVLHTVDLNSFDSIKDFAKSFESAETQLDILVNNAGVMLYPKFKLTEDGHELTWQTNYLGHFLLSELLLPKLELSKKGGRIVNVSAVAHFYAETLDVNTVDRREAFDQRAAYARSKLAQVIHAVEMAGRLRRTNSKVVINACHPGLVYTRIMRHTPLGSNAVLKVLLAPFAWFILKTPKDGAQTPLFCALSKDVDGKSGKYFAELEEQTPAEVVQDETIQQQLYSYSVEACGVQG